MDAASLLPAVDSDEDPELAELNKPASVRSRDGSHLVGREHPFSPMVNRCAGERGREGGTLITYSPSHCSLLLPPPSLPQGDAVQSGQKGLQTD